MVKTKKLNFRSLFQAAVIILACFCVFGFRYLTPFPGLTPLAMQVLGIFIGAILLWLFVSIGWPSLFVIIAAMMTPLYTYTEVLAGSIGSWVVSFVIFSTALSYVLKKMGFFRRCAVWILTRPLVKKGPWALLIMLSLGAIVIGSFVSALTIYLIFVPIVEEIFREVGYEKGHRVPMLMTICLLIFTSFANLTTPIAHVVPIMGIALYTQYTGGLEISFLQYIAAGIPLCAILFAAMILLMKFTYKADFSKITNIDTDFLLKDHKPMGKDEKLAVAVFFGVVFLWVAPGILGNVTPGFAAFLKSLGSPTPPMLGIIALCILKVDGKPVMDIGDAISNGVSWSTFMLVAGTQILGALVTNEEVGLTSWISGFIAPAINGLPPIICVLVILLFVIIMTNFASNVVTVTIVTSIVIPMIHSGALTGIDAAAIAFLIGNTACMIWATPASSSQSAIAVGDGWLDTRTMLIWGLILNFSCGLIMTFVGYPLVSFMFGLF